MHEGLRRRTMIVYRTMLMLSWSLMLMGLPGAYSQPAVPIEPAPKEQLPSTMTPTEAEQVGEAERVTEAERARAEREGTAQDVRHETRDQREFCRLQPYGGIGLGVFFANLSSNGNSASDNGVPGLNALGGLRYYFTERSALFGEYKYNYAVFDFSVDGLFGGAVGVKGNYQVNHIVGGLSVHF